MAIAAKKQKKRKERRKKTFYDNFGERLSGINMYIYNIYIF